MRVGAIDIGTNSIHLLIAEVSPEGTISVVEKAREQVELGAGEFGHGADGPQRLTDDAFERGVAAMTRFKQACDSFDVEDVHAAATSAVREAENGFDFCQAVKQATGIHVRVIAGLEEARLIYLGARADLDFSAGRALLFDVGGGSTEFVLCDAEQALVTESLPLGHIRLADAWLRSDPLTEPERRAVKTHVQQLLQPLLSRVRSSDFATLVGTSGTVRTLARIATLARREAQPEHEHGLVLRRSELEELIRTFRARPSATWTHLPGMDERRRRTLPAGAILVREVMRALDKDQLVTSERSLRDGLVVDWILRHRPELDIARAVADPRRRSVLHALGRYNGDEVHARLVADFATRLFDATAPLHQLSADDRRMLEFGAMLHDIGHYISGEDHNRHAQYLIRHTRMPGFTAPEIALLGNLVRYHRGGRPKLRHPEFAALAARDRRRVKLLSAMLRLADAFDRGHNQNVVHLEVALSDAGVDIHAWTREPGHLERWAAVQRVATLEAELERNISVRVETRPEA